VVITARTVQHTCRGLANVGLPVLCNVVFNENMGSEPPVQKRVTSSPAPGYAVHRQSVSELAGKVSPAGRANSRGVTRRAD
jgi:hypothetical protein